MPAPVPAAALGPAHIGLWAPWWQSQSTAPPNVATETTVIVGGAASTASVRLVIGTRNTVAPAAAAPSTLYRTPPTGPTWPTASMVPVPAMARPPFREPPARASVNAKE